MTSAKIRLLLSLILTEISAIMSTRVDYYLLQSQDQAEIHRFVCRLCQKAYEQGHKVFICTDNVSELDELLWSFNPTSFLPHSAERDNASNPINIGNDAKQCKHQDILLNLTERLPSEYTVFSRVIEVVAGDEHSKQTARKHYRQYQQQGATLQTHQIK